tara:strand:- start:107 stop:673 length:567 start_codon:yes stop_codon:yes gene_type:complete
LADGYKVLKKELFIVMADKKKKYPQWIYTVNIVLWSLVLIGIVGGLILEKEEKNGFVSKEMYGDKWPLTVDSGTLSCVSAENLNDHLWAYETFFISGEKKYTVYSREAQDGLFEGKKPKYPYWDELKLKTEKLNILGLPSAKDVKFLESKARGLCREYDKDGISRYKLVPAWQRKDREKQGLSVYILK